MNTNIVGKPKEELAQESISWAVKAKALRIVDAASCVNASQFLRSVKGLRSDIQSWFAPHIEAFKATKRQADEGRAGLVDEQARIEAPLVEAEGVVKRALLVYETDQENRRREEERRLQEDARKRSEALTLEAAAEMELRAKAEGDAGMLQEAIDILDQPIDAPVVSVASAMPKVQGVTYRDNWKPHPDVDIKALASAVAAGTVSPNLVMVNWPALNALAKATKGTQPVPGVKFYNDRQIAARG